MVTVKVNYPGFVAYYLADNVAMAKVLVNTLAGAGIESEVWDGKMDNPAWRML